MLRHSYGLAKATAPDDDDDDDSGHRSSKAHMFLMKRRRKETDTRTTNCVKKRSDKIRREKHYQRKNKTSQQTNKQGFSFPIHILTERIRSWRCGRASRKRQRDRSELFTTTTRWLRPHIFFTTPRGDMQST
jgi:hypothetical protein